VFGEGLFAFLGSNAAVTAILGTARKDKQSGIFAVKMTDEADLPAVVVTQIAGTGDNDTLDGAESTVSARYQFSCYGKNYADAKRLARAVKKSLVGYRGTWHEGTEIQVATLVLETDGFEAGPLAYHVPLDLEFVYADVGS
jgi:hypothetical protein